jgi:hypothetical protein
MSGEHELPVKAFRPKRACLPRAHSTLTSAWPKPRSHAFDRTVACQSRVGFFLSLHGLYATNARAHVAERDGASIRVLTEPSRNRNCEAMPPLRSPPRGYPTLPWKCPFCPYYSTPSRNWGSPKAVMRACNHFYTSRSALRHSPSFSLFRHFGRENFMGPCKKKRRGCAIVHLCHGVSPTKYKQKRWAQK